jgi:two-component system, NarL family, sensor kinase
LDFRFICLNGQYTPKKMEANLFKIIITGILIIGLISFFLIWFVIMHRKNYNQYVQEKKLLQYQYQQELLRTQLEIHEQTLKTISQEIHDNIGQVLSLAKLNLNTMDMEKQAELQGKIDDSRNLVSKAIHDLRHLSRSLNTESIAAIGLLKAVGNELEMLRKAGYDTFIETEGTFVKLEPQKELILFRIIQETLNNIIKHAEAKKIYVHAVYSTNDLRIVIRDDGKGMVMLPAENYSGELNGIGIRNMESRASLIGAQLKISSVEGTGTEVSINVPLKRETQL